MGSFKVVFNHPDQKQSSGQQLLRLQQRQESATDYSIRFCTLAAVSGWNELALVIYFCRELNAELQTELVCRNADLDLEGLIELAIKLDQHPRNKQRCTTLPPRRYIRFQLRLESPPRGGSPVLPSDDDAPEPTQLGSSRLSAAERGHCLSR